jgi:hypothetical protein
MGIKTLLLVTALSLGTAATFVPSARAATSSADCPKFVQALPPLPPPTFEDGPMISAPDLVSDFDGWPPGCGVEKSLGEDGD